MYTSVQTMLDTKYNFIRCITRRKILLWVIYICTHTHTQMVSDSLAKLMPMNDFNVSSRDFEGFFFGGGGYLVWFK